MEDDLLSPEDIERMAGAAGIPLTELCKRAGISHTTFYRWKNGERLPTMRVYVALRRALRDAEAA